MSSENHTSDASGKPACSVADWFGRLHGINASVMCLSLGDSHACYIVPDDPDSDAAFIATASNQIVVEINLPRATALNGYEAYLRQGFSPPNVPAQPRDQ